MEGNRPRTGVGHFPCSPQLASERPCHQTEGLSTSSWEAGPPGRSSRPCPVSPQPGWTGRERWGHHRRNARMAGSGRASRTRSPFCRRSATFPFGPQRSAAEEAVPVPGGGPDFALWGEESQIVQIVFDRPSCLPPFPWRSGPPGVVMVYCSGASPMPLITSCQALDSKTCSAVTSGAVLARKRKCLTLPPWPCTSLQPCRR